MNKKQVIAGLLPAEVKTIISQRNLPAYRAQQILSWIFDKGALSFCRMSNLPAKLRNTLNTYLQPVSLTDKDKFLSADKTVKYIFRTADAQRIESVFIPTKKRATVCVSTQIGCAFGCVFCASGMKGIKRNLSPDEIVSQVLLIKADNLKDTITNIVIMGSGEPLSNYNNTLKAVRILNAPDGLGLAARKITISTCGLPKEILRLAKEKLQIELSISLHAAGDDLRSKLMPVNKKYPLTELIRAAKEYTRITNRLITFEYVLIDGVNDSRQAAVKLAELLRGLRCKINLIPFNRVENLPFSPPKRMPFAAFKQVLRDKNINFTVRRSRGSDVKAACGQLAYNFK